MIIRQLKAKLRRILSLAKLQIIPSSIFTRATYSQCGEDLLVLTALNLIKGNVPFSYLDVGANDPYTLSNTALLYTRGGSGFLIEPNPELAKRLKIGRGDRDRVLQCGISVSNEVAAELYVMEPDVLSTFSKKRRFVMSSLVIKYWTR